MAALIFMLVPAFFGGQLEALLGAFHPVSSVAMWKKTPYGARLADKLSKIGCLSRQSSAPNALCNRKTH